MSYDKSLQILLSIIPLVNATRTGTKHQTAQVIHSKLRLKSSQWHLGKKLHQTSRVDFCLPMGIESLWFEYRDLFPELFKRYTVFCAAKNEVIQIGHFLT